MAEIRASVRPQHQFEVSELPQTCDVEFVNHQWSLIKRNISKVTSIIIGSFVVNKNYFKNIHLEKYTILDVVEIAHLQYDLKIFTI